LDFPPQELFAKLLPQLNAVQELRVEVGSALNIPVEFVSMAKFQSYNRKCPWKVLVNEVGIELDESCDAVIATADSNKRGKKGRKGKKQKEKLSIKDGDIIGIVDIRQNEEITDHFGAYQYIYSDSSPPKEAMKKEKSQKRPRAPDVALKINLELDD